MSLVRGQLKKGFYIRMKSEKVYLSEVKKGKLIYSMRKGKGARKFRSLDEAYEYLDKYDLRKSHKVIEVR